MLIQFTNNGIRFHFEWGENHQNAEIKPDRSLWTSKQRARVEGVGEGKGYGRIKAHLMRDRRDAKAGKREFRGNQHTKITQKGA